MLQAPCWGLAVVILHARCVRGAYLCSLSQRNADLRQHLVGQLRVGGALSAHLNRISQMSFHICAQHPPTRRWKTMVSKFEHSGSIYQPSALSEHPIHGSYLCPKSEPFFCPAAKPSGAYAKQRKPMTSNPTGFTANQSSRGYTK